MSLPLSTTQWNNRVLLKSSTCILILQYLRLSTPVWVYPKNFFTLLKIFFHYSDNFFSSPWKILKTTSDLDWDEGGLLYTLNTKHSTLNPKPHFAAPCQAKNKNRLLSKKRAPTPHQHRVSVENRLIHCTLQSTTDTLEKMRKTFDSSSILGQVIAHHSSKKPYTIWYFKPNPLLWDRALVLHWPMSIHLLRNLPCIGVHRSP